jgi:hypothetical protein
MWVMTRVADWWDENRARTEGELDRFVDEHPNQFGFIVATAVHTAMTVGAGTVDVLRLGDGIAKDGLRGAGTDGLRLLSVLPVGRAVRILKLSNAIKATRVIQDVPGGRCAWVAATRAMAATAQKVDGKIFIRVEDLVGATGIPWPVTSDGVSSLSAFAHILRNIGAKVGPERVVNSLQGLTSMLRYDGSVAVIGIQFLRFGKREGHAIVAFFDELKRLKFLDRNGKVYNSLEEVMARYQGVDTGTITLTSAVTFENVFAKLITDGTTTLAIEILGVNVSEKK